MSNYEMALALTLYSVDTLLDAVFVTNTCDSVMNFLLAAVGVIILTSAQDMYLPFHYRARSSLEW